MHHLMTFLVVLQEDIFLHIYETRMLPKMVCWRNLTKGLVHQPDLHQKADTHQLQPVILASISSQFAVTLNFRVGK